MIVYSKKHILHLKSPRYDPLHNVFTEMGTSRDGSVETDGSALGISTNRAAMIEYAPDASRLKTYNRWPAASPVFAKDLCEAGKHLLLLTTSCLDSIMITIDNNYC